MVLLLSDMGIIASSGSACTSARLTASHVLTAIGVSAETSHGSLRFSLGKETTESEIDEVIKKLPKVITKLRDMSPLTKL
jgi:cysteine desulfurase